MTAQAGMRSPPDRIAAAAPARRRDAEAPREIPAAVRAPSDIAAQPHRGARAPNERWPDRNALRRAPDPTPRRVQTRFAHPATAQGFAARPRASHAPART